MVYPCIQSRTYPAPIAGLQRLHQVVNECQFIAVNSIHELQGNLGEIFTANHQGKAIGKNTVSEGAIMRVISTAFYADFASITSPEISQSVLDLRPGLTCSERLHSLPGFARPPFGRCEDSQLLTIFHDGTPGNLDTPFLQYLGDSVITQRPLPRFVFDQFPDLHLDCF